MNEEFENTNIIKFSSSNT